VTFLLLTEWCNHWPEMRGLRAALPGQANNSSYLQTAEPDTGAQLAMVDFPGVAVGDHEGLKDLRVHLE
jgi:hypothetical protein